MQPPTPSDEALKNLVSLKGDLKSAVPTAFGCADLLLGQFRFERPP